MLSLAIAMAACEKSPITHEVSYYIHSDSVGFELVYLGANSDTNFVSVNDTHVTVYPFIVESGYTYMATVFAYDYASRVDVQMYVDKVEVEPESVLQIDSFAVVVEGVIQ